MTSCSDEVRRVRYGLLNRAVERRTHCQHMSGLSSGDKGHGISGNPGNVKFRIILQERREEYLAIRNKKVSGLGWVKIARN